MASAPDPTATIVMPIRNRKSRIYFLRQFFDYPIKLSGDTLRKLGLLRTAKIGVSYAASMVNQKKPEKTLEQFLINRFGRELYLTFFKSYTEKVWGVPCSEISAEWGAQRIKGLSILKAVTHFLGTVFARNKRGGGQGDLAQKGTETSLIEKFMYPKLGPGQLWEYVAEDVQRKGGSVETGWSVEKLHTEGFQIKAAEAVHAETGERRTFEADFFFSTMPIKELMRAIQAPVPANVMEVSEGLIYRDFITVGLLLRNLKVKEESAPGSKLLADNWIYIQEPDVLVGRMQIFNNWSPYLGMADPAERLDRSGIFLLRNRRTLEAARRRNDQVWRKNELETIGIIDQNDVLDACVIRVPKTYPAYFGAYERFDEIREYIDRFENLFLIGRNGMHKYNNQDYLMLTAMTRGGQHSGRSYR